MLEGLAGGGNIVADWTRDFDRVRAAMIHPCNYPVLSKGRSEEVQGKGNKATVSKEPCQLHNRESLASHECSRSHNREKVEALKSLMFQKEEKR